MTGLLHRGLQPLLVAACLSATLIVAGCDASPDHPCIQPQCGPCAAPLSLTVIPEGGEPPWPLATVTATRTDGTGVAVHCGGGGEEYTSCELLPDAPGFAAPGDYVVQVAMPGYESVELTFTVPAEVVPPGACGCFCGHIPQYEDVYLQPAP